MRLRWLIISAVVLALLIAGVVLVKPLPKQRAESVQCVNQMVAIGFAAMLWANDHKEVFPGDLLTISNEVVSPKILHCAADASRRRTTNWASFATNGSSYEIVTRPLSGDDTNSVFLRCRIHGHFSFADATVFDGKTRGLKRAF